MTRLVLGVIGHVDHGKTALVRALTGEDTDRLIEEKRRGISIVLGFAHLALGPGLGVDLIDMPGHERFVRTMISGANGIDAVLLVVAANEGVKPQTIEHIDIAGLLGLHRAVVAITKTDLVEPEKARRVGKEAMRLLVRSGLESQPPIMISALRETGIEKLRQALTNLAEAQSPRPADRLAFLPIDRAFSIVGHGPVVTGTLRGAAVGGGDMLELLPLRRTVRVRGLQVHGETVASATPGQRVALNLRGIAIGELRPGMTLGAPGTLLPSEWLTLSIRAVAGVSPLKNGMSVRAIIGTNEVEARLRLLDRDMLEAGELGFAQLRCAEPIAVPIGEHAIIRIASPPATVAGGKILEAVVQRQRRHYPAAIQRLEELRRLPPAAIVAAEIERQGSRGTTLRALSQISGLAPWRIGELLQRLAVEVSRSGMVVQKTDLDRLVSRILSLLTRQPKGYSRDELRTALPGVDATVLDEALGRLLAAGSIRKRGSHYLIPRPDDDRARARTEAELASRIAETLRLSGLTPPRSEEIVTDGQSKHAVERLLREGVIVRAVDRAKGREILFHQDAIHDARRRLAPLLAEGPGLLVTEIGEALGISRKYSMPLLDHLDSIRFTRRIRDRRLPGLATLSGQ